MISKLHHWPWALTPRLTQSGVCTCSWPPPLNGSVTLGHHRTVPPLSPLQIGTVTAYLLWLILTKAITVTVMEVTQKARELKLRNVVTHLEMTGSTQEDLSNEKTWKSEEGFRLCPMGSLIACCNKPFGWRACSRWWTIQSHQQYPLP